MSWQYAISLIILVTLSVTVRAEVVLETDDNAATFAGTWNQSQATPGYYGSDFAIASGGGSADSARFFSQRPITTTGTWCIQAHWTAGANRTTAARYQVLDGTVSRATFIANQQSNGGAWRRLGCVQLTAGRTGEVRLSDTNVAAGSIVVADGVRWVWEESPAQSLCVAVNGGFGNGGTTFVGQGFSVPANGTCKPWAGVVKTASTVVGTTTGAGCTSSDGKVLTLTLQSTNPSFFGNNAISDHIQICPGGPTGCPVAQSDQGSFFTGIAALTNCTATLLQIPSVHD